MVPLVIEDQSTMIGAAVLIAIIVGTILYANSPYGKKMARAERIKELRRQRKARYYHKLWMEDNKDFIRERNKEIDREVDEMCNTQGEYMDPSTMTFKKDYIIPKDED